MQITILGRQPKLSLAELEALFGAEKITPISNYAALIDIPDVLPQDILGGTMKTAKVLTNLKNADLEQAFAYLQTSIPENLQYLPEGKLQLGVSIYGFKAQRDWLLRQMLTLKKIVKKQGQSVRIIENKHEALESAQVLYNKLTGPLGWELLLIKRDSDVIVAQTTAVQNIDEYSKRDFGRPKRDAFVGMLPPKLAQTMINLAKPHDDAVIVDPFCGTGVVLQEALLMGYDVIGSDLSDRMIEYSQVNTEWILQHAQGARTGKVLDIRQADATNYSWNFSKLAAKSSQIDISVVCETYLGKPLTTVPEKHALAEIMNEANTIAEGFLKNLTPQLAKGARACIALPAWNIGSNRFLHLKVLDQLENLGYNRLDFVHAKKEDLIYHRTDQVVARELTILEKK